MLEFYVLTSEKVMLIFFERINLTFLVAYWMSNTVLVNIRD